MCKRRYGVESSKSGRLNGREGAPTPPFVNSGQRNSRVGRFSLVFLAESGMEWQSRSGRSVVFFRGQPISGLPREDSRGDALAANIAHLPWRAAD